MNKVRTRMQVPKCFRSSLEDAAHKISMIKNKLGSLNKAYMFLVKQFHLFFHKIIFTNVKHGEQD